MSRCSSVRAGAVESTRYLRNPLDVLAQQIVAMAAMDEWEVERLFDEVSKSNLYNDQIRLEHATYLVFHVRFDDAMRLYGNDKPDLRFDLRHHDLTDLIIEHGGGINGFTTYEMTLPEDDVYIAILTNSGRGEAMYDKVIRAELSARFDLHEPRPQSIEMSPEALAAFAGVYTRQQRGKMVITATSDGLRVESTLKNLLTGEEETTPPQEMRPISASEFIVVTPHNDDVRTFARQDARNSFTDAAPAASHDGRLALQFHMDASRR